MKWTIRKFNVSTPSRYCWALALAFFFTLRPISASADAASDQQIIELLQDIYNHQSTEYTARQIEVALNGASGVKDLIAASNGYLSGIDDVLNDIELLVRRMGTIPDYSTQLSTLSSSLSAVNSNIITGNTANHNDLLALQSALSDVFARQRDAMFMNSNMIDRLIRKPSGVDVLAGNAWWATNSAFVLTQPRYSLVYPHESPDSAYSFSFPQFLSKWSSFLSYPWSGTSIGSSEIREKWWSYWGRNRYGGGLVGGISTTQPYTWFDWMADATRSNWTERATWRTYVHDVDVAGFAASNSIADDIAYQQYQDTHAVNEAEDDMRSETEPDQPEYTVATVTDDPDADKDNLLDALEEDVEHSTRLVLINGTDFKDATGVDGEMVFNLAEGRFSTFVSDMSSISRAGWYALLAVMSATLFWRKQNEISAIVKGTNFSRV